MTTTTTDNTESPSASTGRARVGGSAAPARMARSFARHRRTPKPAAIAPNRATHQADRQAHEAVGVEQLVHGKGRTIERQGGA